MRAIRRVVSTPAFVMAAKRSFVGAGAFAFLAIALIAIWPGFDDLTYIVAFWASYIVWTLIDIFVGRMPE